MYSYIFNIYCMHLDITIDIYIYCNVQNIYYALCNKLMKLFIDIKYY